METAYPPDQVRIVPRADGAHMQTTWAEFRAEHEAADECAVILQWEEGRVVHPGAPPAGGGSSAGSTAPAAEGRRTPPSLRSGVRSTMRHGAMFFAEDPEPPDEDPRGRAGGTHVFDPPPRGCGGGGPAFPHAPSYGGHGGGGGGGGSPRGSPAGGACFMSPRRSPPGAAHGAHGSAGPPGAHGGGCLVSPRRPPARAQPGARGGLGLSPRAAPSPGGLCPTPRASPSPMPGGRSPAQAGGGFWSQPEGHLPALDLGSVLGSADAGSPRAAGAVPGLDAQRATSPPPGSPAPPSPPPSPPPPKPQQWDEAAALARLAAELGAPSAGDLHAQQQGYGAQPVQQYNGSPLPAWQHHAPAPHHGAPQHLAPQLGAPQQGLLLGGYTSPPPHAAPPPASAFPCVHAPPHAAGRGRGAAVTPGRGRGLAVTPGRGGGAAVTPWEVSAFTAPGATAPFPIPPPAAALPAPPALWGHAHTSGGGGPARGHTTAMPSYGGGPCGRGESSYAGYQGGAVWQAGPPAGGGGGDPSAGDGKGGKGACMMYGDGKGKGKGIYWDGDWVVKGFYGKGGKGGKGCYGKGHLEWDAGGKGDGCWGWSPPLLPPPPPPQQQQQQQQTGQCRDECATQEDLTCFLCSEQMLPPHELQCPSGCGLRVCKICAEKRQRDLHEPHPDLDPLGYALVACPQCRGVITARNPAAA
eukprot:TRINITY_DN23733_c0_g1_i12.p1 TRINITY_DN23733_c0_g1~~TRINITY_DN23733_c0_g1_i12.p1  ORF type:complete len:723 (+),score=115.47 TRINITY_DN23733_c0_g1_i12:92-2170(+)